MIFVLKKKRIISFGVCLCFLLCSLYFMGKFKSQETFFDAEGKTIIIDAGHGA